MMTFPDLPASSKGFQNAALYDQNRPSYSADVVDSLLGHLRVRGLTGGRVVDLAAGTGKFTERLALRDEGFVLTAVEPHGEMRKELRKKNLQSVRILEGSANQMDGIEDQSVDAVIAAQVCMFLQYFQGIMASYSWTGFPLVGKFIEWKLTTLRNSELKLY